MQNKSNSSRKGKFEIVSEGVNGSKALKVSISETNTGTDGLGLMAAIFGKVPVTEVGATYRYSISIKTNDVLPDSSACYAGMKVTSGSAKWLPYVTQSEEKSGYCASNNEWITLSDEFVAQTNTAPLEIVINKMTGGYFLLDDISVVKIAEAPTSVTINKESVELEINGTEQLTASLAPENATSTITWSSSNTQVATVGENGLVTAVSAGEATITATSAATTVLDTCTVTVVQPSTTVPPTGIVLPRNTETIFVGETIQLHPTAVNADATPGGWKFASSDENIATVDAITGVVTSVAEGNCTITITNDYASGLSKECNVTVWTNLLVNGGFEEDTISSRWELNADAKNAITNGLAVQTLDKEVSYSGNQSVKIATTGDTNVNFHLCQNRLEVTEGTTYKLIGRIKAENLSETSSVTYKLFCWKGDGANGNPSTNLTPNGKTIDEVVTSKSVSEDGWIEIEGFYTVPVGGAWMAIQLWFAGTGTVWYDEIAAIEWQPITEITLDTTSKYLELNEEYTLNVTTLPVESLDHTVIFESSNSEVASVDENGKITAKSIGEAVITATATNGGVSAQCKITVIEEYIVLENIGMKSELELCVGSRETLSVTYNPENATNKEILWSSSDEAIATVDENGLITALKEGSAVITATADNNITKTCNVTVEKSGTLLLTDEKAEFTTDFGKSVQGNLKTYIINNTGSEEITFELLTGPVNGTLELKSDGTFNYLPKGNYDVSEKEHFVVIVTAGTETVLLEVEISVNEVKDSMEKLLTEDTTLFITRDELASIKEEIKDSTSARYKIWNDYRSFPEMLLDTTPPKYEDYEDDDDEIEDDENYHAEWMRPIGDYQSNLLFAYLLTEDVRYRDKCLEYTMTSISYPKWATFDWYQEASLAASHQAFFISLVYNWLYDELTDEQRSAIEKRLYYSCGQFVKKWGDSNQYLQNHLFAGMSGLCSSAMSLYIRADEVAKNVGVDAATVKANCVDWIELVCEKVGFTFQVMPQDGSNHEGVGYHTYGLEFLLKSALLLNSNLDVDMFTENAWLENSSEYFANVILPKNSIQNGLCFIDYADGTRGSWYGPSHVYRVLAGVYKDETAQWISEVFEDTNAGNVDSNYWMGLLYADSNVKAVSPYEAGASALYWADDLGIVVSRSDWSGDESMLFIRNGLPLGKTSKAIMDHDILKAGTNESHVDADNNAVILFYNGEYLLKSDGYTWKKTCDNSTLIIGDTTASKSADFTGQLGEGAQGLNTDDFLDLDYEPEFTVLQETDTYNYMVGNATEAYAPALGLKKFERNIVFLKEENVMLVVDDIKTMADKKLQLRWFPENKEVTESYGIYSIYGNKNILKFYPFTTENTDTAFVDVDVYKSGGGTQKEKAFTQTLTGTNWQNAVAFAWGENGTGVKSVRYLEGNDDEHQFEVNGKIYTVNVANNTVTVTEDQLPLEKDEWVSDSSLAQILFNTVALDGFKSDQLEYNVEKFWKVKELTLLPVPSAPNAVANVEWDGKCPGTVKIICTSEDGTSQSEYTLHLTDNEGLLNIEGVSTINSTSNFPDSCMYDSIIQLVGNDKTWASLNLPSVIFDLGALADITKIDVAFNNSSIRSTYFNLLVSVDGVDWKPLIEDGESPITNTGLKTDYHTVYNDDTVSARYVKIDLRSHSVSGKDNERAVNSIQEISIYGTLVKEPVIDEPTTDTDDEEIDNSDNNTDTGNEGTDNSDKDTDTGNEGTDNSDSDTGTDNENTDSDEVTSGDEDNTGANDSSNANDDGDNESDDIVGSENQEVVSTATATGDAYTNFVWWMFVAGICAILVLLTTTKYRFFKREER